VKHSGKARPRRLRNGPRVPCEDAPVLRLRVGIDLASLRLPFKKALHTAAQLGAEAVEIDARNQLPPGELTRTAVRHLRKMLDDLNLRVCALRFRTRRGYDAADDIDRRVDATKQALTAAYELGAGVVVNQIGRAAADAGSPEWSLLTQVLADLGRYGQKAGATLAAETGSEDAAALRRLIDALPAGSLGVCFNPGSLIINGFSATDAIRELGRDTIYLHAQDGVRDLARGRGLEVPLGRGSADFPELLGVLEEHEYRGYATIVREQSDDAIFEIGQAVQFLRSL
jgi:sugar phosphate isomerase/epimerase